MKKLSGVIKAFENLGCPYDERKRGLQVVGNSAPEQFQLKTIFYAPWLSRETWPGLEGGGREWEIEPLKGNAKGNDIEQQKKSRPCAAWTSPSPYGKS